MDKNLPQWLSWISSIHPEEIALGLERVKTVAQRLGFAAPPCPVITVGGTNGKGSCVATLEKIYSEQGYRTGVFTSPILYRHTELLRMCGREVEASLFCEAYAKIERARKEISLTPFEYHTLAVLEILRRHELDVWILEVGLGGRLDAVNIVDADVAVITSIGIDHVDWLGNTRELIGQEKAGIFRFQRPAVCGDRDPPLSLRDYAEKIGAPFYFQGKDFFYKLEDSSWSWRGNNKTYAALPFSQLAFQNISTALMTIELLQAVLPVSETAVARGVKRVSLPGRIEIKTGCVMEIHDVAHNPAAVAFLAERLKKISRAGKTRAIFSMLGDKDLAGSLREIKNQIDEWHVAPLVAKRASSMESLRTAFQAEKIASAYFYSSIAEAQTRARQASKEGDCLLIFGSFYTVSEAQSSFAKQ